MLSYYKPTPMFFKIWDSKTNLIILGIEGNNPADKNKKGVRSNKTPLL